MRYKSRFSVFIDKTANNISYLEAISLFLVKEAFFCRIQLSEDAFAFYSINIGGLHGEI
mgnify:CR=1 FL=1